MTTKNNFFEECVWFKFNNLGLALGMVFNLYARVAKGLKVNFRKFGVLIATFAEVTAKKKTGKGRLVAPLPILNRFNSLDLWWNKSVLAERFIRTLKSKIYKKNDS